MPVSVWSLFQALFAVFGIVLQWTLLGGFVGFTVAAFFWLGAIRPRLRRPQQERIMLFGGVVALSFLWGILAGFSVGLTRAYGVALERNETLRACAATLSTGVADGLCLAVHGDARLEEWRGGTLRVSPRDALERVSRSGTAFEEQVSQGFKELPADAAGEFLLSSLPIRGRDVAQWCDWVSTALGTSVEQAFTRAEMAELLRDRILAAAFSSALHRKLLKWQMWCLTLLVVGYAAAFLFACGPRSPVEPTTPADS